MPLEEDPSNHEGVDEAMEADENVGAANAEAVAGGGDAAAAAAAAGGGGDGGNNNEGLGAVHQALLLREGPTGFQPFNKPKFFALRVCPAKKMI